MSSPGSIWTCCRGLIGCILHRCRTCRAAPVQRGPARWLLSRRAHVDPAQRHQTEISGGRESAMDAFIATLSRRAWPPGCASWAHDGQLRRTRAGQPDRRTHRLQPGFRAADCVAAAHRCHVHPRAHRRDHRAQRPRRRLGADPARHHAGAGDRLGSLCGRGDLGAAGRRPPGARRGDVDHQRRRDRVGAFVVGGADRRGAGRGRRRHRHPHRPSRAGRSHSEPRTTTSVPQRVCSTTWPRCSERRRPRC